jgi:hypothetical protein
MVEHGQKDRTPREFANLIISLGPTLTYLIFPRNQKDPLYHSNHDWMMAILTRSSACWR